MRGWLNLRLRRFLLTKGLVRRERAEQAAEVGDALFEMPLASSGWVPFTSGWAR